MLLSIHELNLQLAGWIPVLKRNVLIEWDLESTPLEVRTNSVLGSGDEVDVRWGNFLAGIKLNFASTLQYQLHWCSSSWTNFPVTEPSANDKVWRITLTRTAGIRLVIHCNDVEVLNTLFSEATCSYSGWSKAWSRDVAKIKFPSDDTASDYYGPQPGD